MPYSEGQSLFGNSHGFQVGYLSLDPLANPETVQALLQADPRMSTGVTIYLESTYSNSFNQSNSNLLILSSLMVLVSLLAVTFGIYNATSLNITERIREIGLLRLIGFNQGQDSSLPARPYPGVDTGRIRFRLGSRPLFY